MHLHAAAVNGCNGVVVAAAAASLRCALASEKEIKFYIFRLSGGELRFAFSS